MSFTRPTLTDLISRIQSDIASRLPGTDPLLRSSALSVIARALAGVAFGLYGYESYISEQILPDTADEDNLPRWGDILKVPRKDPVAAAGSIDLTGTDGSPIPAGTLWQRSDGAQFSSAADATIVSGTATVSVTASTAGAAGNTAAGSALSLVYPVPGVNSAATVGIDGLTNGYDLEDLEAWRSRILYRLQNPPQGGASQDYIDWALQVAGVTRAWVYPLNRGNGTVDLYFVCDDQATTIIPDATQVAAVQSAIDAVRPVTADFLAIAPTAVPLDFTIQLTPSGDATVQAAVEAELQDLISREAEPGGTLLLSHINEAISTAAGETDHVLTAPAANVTNPAGSITTMGAITWS